MNAASIQSEQKCSSCGAQAGRRDPHITCAKCGGLLDIVHPADAAAGPGLKDLFGSRVAITGPASPATKRSGVWRYRELVLPDSGDDVVSFPEGNTPLLSRDSISRWAGIPGLLLKHEGLNPTGSFKDRGMAVALTQAKRIGAAAVACASTGNTSSSLAAYAAIAGIPSLVLVPSGLVAAGKLAQTIAYGARTLMVRGDFDDCLRLVIEASEKLGVYLVNSVNPFRIEGQKTIVLEMLQQLDWRAPDWIAVPAGNLGNAAAFGKALREARELGLIEKTPRLLLVQAAGAAPFARSFRDGFTIRHRVQAETVASAIRIGDPASYDRAVRAVRETDGIVIDVTDEEILEAKAIIDGSGVGCEPASAASLAGTRKLAASGTIRRADAIVAVLTGHLLKDASADGATTGEKFSGSRTPVEIDATLKAVEKALKN